MKPIRLSLAGLHSFREAQEIDFERLCEAGLFGIFGPTGSGKSSILDAITLALYGQVERAARGIQGILNHAEERVLVDFTFELAHPEGRRRYRVERVYRRSGENTVNTAGGRLVEITPGGEVPLAEKGKVTGRVEEILGLDKDEFTRAVVLPQGKFADFLKLEPARRRGMLQNLFGLHDYGDRLRQKVNEHLLAVNSQLTGVRGELEGLGDASDRMVNQSLDRLNNALKLAAQAAANRVKVEDQVKKLEQVWTWQEELNEVQTALEALEGRQPEINLYMERLDAANGAEKARPYLLELDEAEANHKQAQTDLLAAGESLRLAVDTAGSARLALAEAQGRRKEDEPALIEKKARLARAAQLENEISSLRDEGVELARALDKQEKEKSRVASDLEACRGRKQVLEQSISSCRARLAEIQVSPERRRRVNAAVTALQHYRKALKERELAESMDREKYEALVFCQKKEEAAALVCQEAQENLRAAGAIEKELRENCPDDAEIQSQFLGLERIRAQVGKVLELTGELTKSDVEASGLQAELAKIQNDYGKASGETEEAVCRLEEARKQVEEAEGRLESLRKSDLASHLARWLHKGKPCPVCGSPHHPKPAPAAGEETLKAAEDELRQAREAETSARDSLESARHTEALLEAGLKNISEAYRQTLAEQEQKRTVLFQMRSKLPTPWAELPAEKITSELSLAEEDLSRRQEACNSWRKSLEEQQLALQRAQEAFNGASTAWAVSTGDSRGAANARNEAGERLRAAVEEERLCLAALDEVRTDLPVEQIEQEQQRIEQWDNEKNALEERRESLEIDLGKVNLDIETLNRSENLLAVEISRAREKLDGLRAHYKQKAEELKDITGGRAAGELLDSTEALIKQLRDAEDQAKLACEETERDRGRWEQESAAAERAFTLAGQRFHAARQRLSAALKELNFATRDQAESALLRQEELDRMAGELENHRKEREKLSGRRQALVEKLNGRTLTGEEWSDWLESQAAAQKEHENALLEQGAARTAYDKIVQDNVRWRELEQQGRELGTLKGRLEVLEKLFRGNAFVEYLAEEQLGKVARDASARLGQLTRHRYALEVDSESGFIMRDDGNGGVKRPVSTLSGGETFITSLALALALSAQIQLKGQYPLEFFFLDEGFGTLDPDLLEVVVSTLEQLRLEHLTIGVISHVPELKNRLPRRLLVQPAQQSGAGSRVILESA